MHHLASRLIQGKGCKSPAQPVERGTVGSTDSVRSASATRRIQHVQQIRRGGLRRHKPRLGRCASKRVQIEHQVVLGVSHVAGTSEPHVITTFTSESWRRKRCLSGG